MNKDRRKGSVKRLGTFFSVAYSARAAMKDNRLWSCMPTTAINFAPSPHILLQLLVSYESF